MQTQVKANSRSDSEIWLSPMTQNHLRAFTVDRSKGRTALGIIPKYSLFGRQKSSPGKVAPFAINGKISNPTNTTNATVDLPSSQVSLFKVGDVCTYFSMTTKDYFTGASKTISSISGVTITFSGTWSTPPDVNDYLVLDDGTRDSDQVVLSLEDIDFSQTTDMLSTFGFVGVVNRLLVRRILSHDNVATLYQSVKNQRLILHTPHVY